MALIKCPECNREISDKAKQCIHCGFPLDEYLQEKDSINKENEKLKEKYWCRNCYRQNKIGEDYCEFCGNRLTPYYEMENLSINNHKEENNVEKKPEIKQFNGIYRYSLFGQKQEVYCPRCGSDNCSHYQEQRIVPGKTKTKYSANLNPLKPFTLINKKEKVIRKDEVVTDNKIICNSCGYIFK